MSLFKTREWWTTQLGVNEEFQGTSLAIGNIDNDTQKKSKDKIVTGSFSGILRIHYPESAEYKAKDLILEKNLGEPILQVEIGRFVGTAEKEKINALAVLHPRKLSVYTIEATTVKNFGMNMQQQQEENNNNTSHHDGKMLNYELVEHYSHELKRMAYNFCYGPFGDNYGVDFLCIQSFDGQLSFYQQERFLFARFLTNFLVPGPIRYFKPLDAFLTYSSEMKIECYKYKVLLASVGSSEKDANLTQGGKRLQVDWAVNVGEEVYDIRVARYSRYLSATQHEIIVLGERTLFTIKENGTISSQKRLDYFPSCIDVYVNAEMEGNRAAKHKLLIGTHSKTLMIYKDPKLIWGAGTTTIPCAVRVGSFGGLAGKIVTLDDTGRLSVNYLGTDPATNSVPQMEKQDFNYVEMEEEHRRLQAVIRQTKLEGRKEPEERIVIRAQVPKQLSRQQVSQEDDSRIRRVTVKLYVGYTGATTLTDVSLTLSLPAPFETVHQVIDIDSLPGGENKTPLIIPILVTCPASCSMTPSSLEASARALYADASGSPRTCTCKFLLPLILAGQLVPPKKTNTNCRLLMATNQPPPKIAELFSDCMLQENQVSSSSSILTFQYVSGVDVSILLSRNAGRYRIQSNSFTGLTLILSELVRRLTIKFSNSSLSTPFAISFPDPLPMPLFDELINTHFRARRTLSHSMEELEKRAAQFRSIQKRLLVRFKDRNPTPLNGMDKLYDATHASLVSLSRTVEGHQHDLQASAFELSSATSLLQLLITRKYSLSEKDVEVLVAHFPHHVNDDFSLDDISWEDLVFVSLSHLLQHSLKNNAASSSTSVRDRAQQTFSLSFSPENALKDPIKLSQVLLEFISRLEAGAKLYIPPPSKKSKRTK